MSKKNSSLSQKALLVSVNVSQWTGRKADKKATETVIKNHKADKSAGKYNKKLLPATKEFDLIATTSSRARKYFHEQTLPWMTDGSRIISSDNFLPFSAEMRKLISAFDKAVEDFEKLYPKLIVRAKATLGDLFNENEYPTPKEIKEKFNIEVSYLPLPDVKDFRVSISESEKKVFIKKMREVENKAIQDCWERMHKVVQHAAKKLNDPESVFRDSLIENIKEMVDVLPKLNITEDRKLEKQRKEIESFVKGMTTKDLRDDSNKRSEAAQKLSEIESKMSVFMGVSK